MAYIEVAGPRDYGFHTLFVYPYQEGIRNLCAQQSSLLERVKHAVAGALLLIPIINTIVFLVLRELYKFPMEEDLSHALDGPKGSFFIENVGPVVEYIELSEKGLINSDVKINQIASLEYKDNTLVQLSGLLQGNPENQLCAYFALFFLLQAATGEKKFADNETLHPLLIKWFDLIGKKRVDGRLSSFTEELPAGYAIDVRGLSPGEIRYLIENDEVLKCLRTNNCFLIDLNLWRNDAKDECLKKILSEPAHITPLGKSSNPCSFPLYFILQDAKHYYCVWAEEENKYQLIHSMESSVSKKTFVDIINCLREAQQNPSQKGFPPPASLLSHILNQDPPLQGQNP